MVNDASRRRGDAGARINHFEYTSRRGGFRAQIARALIAGRFQTGHETAAAGGMEKTEGCLGDAMLYEFRNVKVTRRESSRSTRWKLVPLERNNNCFPLESLLFLYPKDMEYVYTCILETRSFLS